MGRIDDNLHIGGHLTAASMTVPSNAVVNASVAADAAIARSKLALDTLAEYPVKLTDFRVWDAMQTNLPGTSASDDLAIIGGTFGSAAPVLQTYDVKAAGSVTLRARVTLSMPAEYAAAETVQLRVRGGMTTTVADNSATVDIEAYKIDEFGGIGSDLCSTAAQSINSLTAGDKDFTISASTLSAGDQLDVRITVAVNDAATGTAVKATLGKVSLLCDVRG